MSLFGGAVRRSEGLVHYSGRVWASCKARKDGVCHLTGTPFVKGERIYRPLTNDVARMRRVRAATWDHDALVAHKESDRAKPPA